jgi:NADPH:quinone reductase-like Zn-dependent oxidoreductase
MRERGGDVAGGVARVVIAAGYGVPEVLSVAEEPVPEPGPGEARIEVRAAGVNPVDVKSYSGAFGTDPARLPIRLGAEAAGVVTAAGPGTEIRERAGWTWPGSPGRGSCGSSSARPSRWPRPQRRTARSGAATPPARSP